MSKLDFPAIVNNSSKLNGLQRKYLRGLAHSLAPVVLIGANGVTNTLISNIQEQLTAHELIKIKFIASKDKPEKEHLREEIANKTNSEVVGVIGHCAVLFAPHPDKNQRQIRLPKSSSQRPSASNPLSKPKVKLPSGGKPKQQHRKPTGTTSASRRQSSAPRRGKSPLQ